MFRKLFGTAKRKDRSPREIDFLELPTIPEKFNRIYPTGDLPHGVLYDVNPATPTCTCPDFTNTRASWPERDVRRVCEHIFAQLRRVEKGFHPIFQLLIRYARLIERFYEYDDGEVYAVAGFSRGFPGLRIFARLGDDAVMGEYDTQYRGWRDIEPKDHRETMDRLAGIFTDYLEE